MPLPIQRVPRGLSDVLTIFGGQTPQNLSDEVSGSVDILQAYGLTQRTTVVAINAAAAEGALVTAPLGPTWVIVYAINVTITKTGTMTALRASVGIGRPTLMVYAADELGPFGATETGSATLALILPYPLICPPNSTVSGIASIIGTDATANVVVQAEIGVLG